MKVKDFILVFSLFPHQHEYTIKIDIDEELTDISMEIKDGIVVLTPKRYASTERR